MIVVLRILGDATLLDHVLARLAGQGGRIVLNANGDPARFARFGLEVVADTVPDHPGPLAGVLAGMEWAIGHAPDCTDIVTVPTDGPFIPRDLIAQLLAARAAEGAELACASSPVRLAGELRAALLGGVRRVEAWTAGFRLVQVPFEGGAVDPFLNINRVEELAEAETLLGRG